MNIFEIRLDLAEISAKPQKHELFNTKLVWILSVPIKVKIGGDSAEYTRRRSTEISLRNLPPIKRYYENAIPYINQVITKENGIYFYDPMLNFANFDRKF